MPDTDTLPVRTPCSGLLIILSFLAGFSAAPAAAQSRPPAVPYPLEIDKAKEAIRDLRVFLDYDDDASTFATWPEDRSGRKLPPDQIARSARLGLALWASVLPAMRFRFVNRAEEANLCIRFGDYKSSGFGRDGGRAFRPSQWAALDVDCGRRAENRKSDGTPCVEGENNIIILYTGTWAAKPMDFRDNLMAFRYFDWVFDPARPHYVKDQGPCRDGKEPGTVWRDTCVPFARVPLADSFPGCDLPAIIQHEFGHTLLGDHTHNFYDCVEYARRPIIKSDSCVRLFDGEFSTMFPGDGVDSWWNRRGLFEADARRLRRMGYQVSYPVSRASIIMSRPDGGYLKTSDWREAHRAMIWPLRARVLTPAEAKRQLFVTDVRVEPAPADAPAATPAATPSVPPSSNPSLREGK
jgi:hypothetical protein